ncbi:hypothetical protein K8O92_29040 [Nocardia asteroides]|nr:hypothetical protein K8O92_29040 [Nocardia asteroides]
MGDHIVTRKVLYDNEAGGPDTNQAASRQGVGPGGYLDVALVRTILVPAAMRTAGTANWWAPGWMAPVVARARLRE